MWILGENGIGTCGRVTRRGFLQAGALGAFGLSLPQLLQGQERSGGLFKGKSVIVLWLWGGPSHLDTFDPKPEAPLEYRGPFRSIPTKADGIRFCEYLPKLAVQADRMAVLRSIYHETNDHGLAGTIALTGKQEAAGRVLPNMGSVVSKATGYRPPVSSFVTVGPRLQQGHRLIKGEGGGILGPAYDPFRVEYDEVDGVRVQDLAPPERVTAGNVERRRQFMKAIDAAREGLFQGSAASSMRSVYDQAFALVADRGARAVFDLEREPAKVRDRYGRFRFGQSCLLARRLVESGVPFVQVNWSTHVEAEEDAGDGGWDMHYRNFEIIQERHLWILDQAMSALIEDLGQRGMLKDTLVVAMGEFGRTPKINDKAGRDHWNQCYSAVLAGGGIRGGIAVGASDARGESPAERPIRPTDIYVTVLERLGISRSAMLGLGVPVEGEAIEELL